MVLEDKNANQEVVDKAAEELHVAIDNLVKREVEEIVNKTVLEKLIAEAEKVNKDEYTEASYNAMVKKIEAAKMVLEDKNANQEVVDKAAEELHVAIDNLVKREVEEIVNKTVLEKLIAEAEKVNKDEYTEASYNAMVKKLEAAKMVLEDKNANQEVVDKATKELQTSIDNLVKKEESNEPPVVTPTEPSNPDNSTNTPKLDNPTELVKTGDESIVLSAITALVLLAVGTVLLKRRKTREGENI